MKRFSSSEEAQEYRIFKNLNFLNNKQEDNKRVVKIKKNNLKKHNKIDFNFFNCNHVHTFSVLRED